MNYQQQIDEIVERIETLTKENPLDPVMGSVVQGLYRILEKRGMTDSQIVGYLRDHARQQCVGGKALY